MIIPSFLPIGYDHVQTFTMANLIISHGVSLNTFGIFRRNLLARPTCRPWAPLGSTSLKPCRTAGGCQLEWDDWTALELESSQRKRPDHWSGANHLSVTMCVCVTLFVGILCRIYYRWSKCNLFLAAAIYWFLGWKGHLSGHGVVSFVSQWLEKRTWVKALVSASFDKPVDGVIRSKVQICGWSCYTKNCPNLWKSLFETSWNDPLQVFQDGDRLA